MEKVSVFGESSECAKCVGRGCANGISDLAGIESGVIDALWVSGWGVPHHGCEVFCLCHQVWSLRLEI
eukprot:13653280-Ditylum_brightwellii.AAC.1